MVNVMPDSISDKVKHVLNSSQTRQHECHWPNCNKQVPPALWGCREHWYMLPEYLRVRIWAAYRIGQEEDGNPSDTYMEVMKMTFKWIKENHGV